MTKVCISGYFDPLHPGHIDYIEKALELGDHLIIILGRDDQLIAKNGYCFMSCQEREEMLKWGLRDRSFEIVPNIDESIECAESIKKYKPDIFVRGGDKTPDNMPLSEAEACRDVGCKVVHGIGGRKRNSSSKLIAEVVSKICGFRPSPNVIPTLTEIEPAAVEQVARQLMIAHQVFLIGNGGSASNASHIANDLQAAGIKAVSLCDNIALLTAIANDKGYEHIFADQLAVKLQPDDVVIVLSGSGKSPSIIKAIEFANELGAFTIGLFGFDGGTAKDIVKFNIILDSDVYGVIESGHLLIGHMIADRISRKASRWK